MVEIIVKGQQIGVRSPYYPAFIEAARRLNGRWNASDKAWYFDMRDMETLKEILIKHYGEDGGGEDVERVTLRLDMNRYPLRGDVDYFAGRQLFQRKERDSRVMLGEGVVIISGGFYDAGGSRKNPIIGQCEAGTVVEVRDVPIKLALVCCQIMGVRIKDEELSPEKKRLLLSLRTGGASERGFSADDNSELGTESCQIELSGEETGLNNNVAGYEVQNFAGTVMSAESARQMFAGLDEAAHRKQYAEEKRAERQKERERILSLSGALNFCEFTSVHIMLDELNSQMNSNLSAVEQEGADSDEVAAQCVEDAEEIRALSQKIINAITANNMKLPTERCKTCHACQEEAAERETEHLPN